MVCKQLSLDVKEFSNFELYVVDDEKLSMYIYINLFPFFNLSYINILFKVKPVTEKPFSIFEKWGNSSDQKFLFKRKDQNYVPFKQIIKPSQQQNNNNANQSSLSQNQPSSHHQPQNQQTQQVSQSQQNNDPNHSKRMTILSWINRHISTFNLQINNLTSDLADGIVLFRLLESLTEKSFKGWNTEPANMMDKLNNLNMFLKLLYHFGIKISGITCEDLYSGNENISMAIVLLLIKKFSKPKEEQPTIKVVNNQSETTTTTRNEENVTENNNNVVENNNSNSNINNDTSIDHEKHFNTDISSYEDVTSTNNNNYENEEVIEEDNLSEQYTTELKPVYGSNNNFETENHSPSELPNQINNNFIPSLPKKFPKIPPPNSKKGMVKIPPKKMIKSPVKVVKTQPQIKGPPKKMNVMMNDNKPITTPITTTPSVSPSIETQNPQPTGETNMYNNNIEIDFSPDVPGSSNNSSMHRRRASTVRNINTNVFDLDAFSDMEDLLKGIAESLDA